MRHLDRDFADLLTRTTEEVLEDRPSAGGDDAHHPGAHDRSVHAQLRGQYRGRDGRDGTAGDLRQTQIYAPFLGFYVTFRLLNHYQPLLDISPTMQQEGTNERSE
ncbi:hypothetical protein ACIGWV_32735 [Streptomyces sp. NPDC055082]|uniref:hypothetical protein n=1 Tax=Streptomyces sp. NPDC055082 TaxID=3365718 RepID=UPI0037CD86CA